MKEYLASAGKFPVSNLATSAGAGNTVSSKEKVPYNPESPVVSEEEEEEELVPQSQPRSLVQRAAGASKAASSIQIKLRCQDSSAPSNSGEAGSAAATAVTSEPVNVGRGTGRHRQRVINRNYLLMTVTISVPVSCLRECLECCL
jgi:hypothetical protein